MCDKLVQEIACLTMSAWSGYPAECGHHIIHRGNLLWRWRLINIAPLTILEHNRTHAGKLKPMFDWQEDMFDNHMNDLLDTHLRANGMIRSEFVDQTFQYLKETKRSQEHCETTWDKIQKQEREKYDC